jgi:hypothetical protein
MLTMLTIKSPKIAEEYNCIFCNYTCCKLSEWKRHMLTLKHQNANNANKKSPKKSTSHNDVNCECGKKFHHLSSLSRHKKICNYINNSENSENSENNSENNNIISPELIMNVLQQNNNLQQLLIEQNKTIIELSKNNQIITNNNNTNMINSNNKSFNLQFFLNETCKDAMNMSEFIESVKIQLSDLENVGKLGFIDGISNIIIKNLEALDVEKRPVHCCDSKRETMYIKDHDKWEKEDVELKQMRELVRYVRDKNISMVNTWRDLYPECVKSDSKKTTQFNQIYMESFGGEKGTKKEKEEKIISKIAKSVIIDKRE